jgi:hypothetical protein
LYINTFGPIGRECHNACRPQCSRGIFEAIVDRIPAGDQIQVDLLHPPAGDQPVAGVPRGGDQVEAALIHQGDHLVGGGSHLDVDLATGFLLESSDPIVIRVGLAAFDVAGPGDDIDLAFTLPDRLQRGALAAGFRSGRLGLAGGQDGAAQG